MMSVGSSDPAYRLLSDGFEGYLMEAVMCAWVLRPSFVVAVQPFDLSSQRLRVSIAVIISSLIFGEVEI